MNPKRDIKLYFIEHSTPIIFYSILAVVVIVGMKGLSYILQKRNDNEIENNLVQEERKENIQYKKIVNKFVTYCKNDELEDAFNMLSSECKEELYPTIEIFKSEFIEKDINIKNDIEVSNTENSEIYTIDILEDSLTSGKIENREANKKIYCKLIEENEEVKIYVNYNN